MLKSGSVGQIVHARRRFGRVGLAAGAAVVMVAAAGVAFAGDGGPSQPRVVLATPSVDAEGARGLALRYLVGRGMSPEKARRRMENQDAALKAVTELRRRAPSGVGSVWLDEGGNLMVRVLDDVGEREAEAVGATPVFSALATADVEAARDALADDVVKNPPAGLSGAVIEIDEAANKVIARYLFEKSGGVVPEAATRLGDLVAASVEVASIRPQADVHVAGAPMVNGENRLCTASWAVDIPVADGGVPKNGVMTAGHCFVLNSPPEQTEYSIDTESAGNTPATGMLFVLGGRGDYGVLELGNGDRGRTSMASTYHVVEAVQESVEGSIVCKDGAWTRQTCGEILRLDISIIGRFRGGGGAHTLMRGMVRVAYCAEPGDSGAPVYAEFDEGRSIIAVAAIGVHSGSINYPDAQGEHVCGEKVDEPNEAFFTPLSGIDTEGRFFVRIDGG